MSPESNTDSWHPAVSEPTNCTVTGDVSGPVIGGNAAPLALRRMRANKTLRFLMPEKRWYPVQEVATSETALAASGLGVIYVVLGDADSKNKGRFVVRIYHHPAVGLVFVGGGLMALGALLAATKRRREEDTA